MIQYYQWKVDYMYNTNRVLVKLSGEALAGDQTSNFDHNIIMGVCKQLKELVDKGTQVSVVIGGGNFWRGRSAMDMDRTKADQIGMLATIMNAIYVADACRTIGLGSVVQTPFIVGSMTEQFSKDKALLHMDQGKVVFFAGGTGHPFFSTDTGAALRGCEVEVDVLLFAKNIDGVYNADPKEQPEATRYETISCKSILDNNLNVIDASAASLCIDQKIPIRVFGLNEENSIIRAASGENIGTLITV